MASITKLSMLATVSNFAIALDSEKVASALTQAFQCNIATYENYETRFDFYIENRILPQEFSVEKIEEAYLQGQELWCQENSPCLEYATRPSYLNCEGGSRRAIFPMGLTSAYQGGYGCWCYFGTTTPLAGYGQPVDELDLECKHLVEGYKCIQEEYFEEHGEDSTPWNHDYNAHVACNDVISGGIEELGISCRENTETLYQEKICLVEIHFQLNLLRISFTQTLDEVQSKKHPTAIMLPGTFNVNEHCEALPSTSLPIVDPTPTTAPGNGDDCPECPPGQGTGGISTGGSTGTSPGTNPSTGTTIETRPVHRFCCGTYPLRKKISSYTPNAQCCGDAVYNSATEKCCGTQEEILLGYNGGASVSLIDDDC